MSVSSILSVVFFLGLVQCSYGYDYTVVGLVMSATICFLLLLCIILMLFGCCFWRSWHHNYQTKRGYKRVSRVRKVHIIKNVSASETMLVDKPVVEPQYQQVEMVQTMPSTVRSYQTVSTVPVQQVIQGTSAAGSRTTTLQRVNPAEGWIVEVPESQVEERYVTGKQVTYVQKPDPAVTSWGGTMNFGEEDTGTTRLGTTAIVSEQATSEQYDRRAQEFTFSDRLRETNANEIDVIFDTVGADTTDRREPSIPLY